MSVLEPLQFPLLLLDQREFVINRVASMLAADQEFSDVVPLDSRFLELLADSLRLPQDPVAGPDELWNEAAVDLSRSCRTIGVVACQLRYLAAAASSILPEVPERERLESAARLHWAMYFGLEVAARVTAQELAIEAFHSDVTGLRNKRSFERDISEKSGEYQLQIAYLDMDGLKIINDSEGHDAGDAALSDLGAAISNQLEAGYTAYHFSGDEFGVLAIDADLESVRALLERVYSLAQHKFSFGIETVAKGESSWEDAFKRAEAAMRRQKKHRKSVGEAPERPLWHDG